MRTASSQSADEDVATGSPKLLSVDARQYSWHLLKIPSDAKCVPVDETLRGVSESGYVVPANSIDAIQILVNPAAVVNRHEVITRADRNGREDCVARLTATFADCYFRLPLDQRRLEWQRLYDLCHDLTALRQWLCDLEPGLDVDCEAVMSDEQLKAFAAQCCNVFVARQPERTWMRRKLVVLYSQDPREWDLVTWNLRLRHGRFAAIVAGWINGEYSTVPAGQRRQATAAADSKPGVSSNGIFPKWEVLFLVIFMAVAFAISAMRGVYESETRPVPWTPKRMETIHVPRAPKLDSNR